MGAILVGMGIVGAGWVLGCVYIIKSWTKWDEARRTRGRIRKR